MDSSSISDAPVSSPHKVTETYTKPRYTPSECVNNPQKLPTPFNQDILLLWNALDVNNPNKEHGNKVKFIPSGSLTHHIAEEVRQNDSYYAFSSKVHLFFHQRCKVAFFRGDFGLKEFYDQLYDGNTGQLFLFHQDRFLPFEKMVALFAINESKCRLFFKMYKMTSTSNTIQKYEEVLDFFNSDENFKLWTAFLVNNPDAATVVFSTLNNYKISTDLIFPTTYSDSSSVARIQYEKVQPLDKFEEPDLELDLRFFDLPGVRRHYGVILKYAAPAIQFLRTIHSLGGCQDNFEISEKFLDSLDNVLAPEHRQLLLEGSRSPVEMLLSIIESFSNHPYGNEWSIPDIHSSWIHLFEEVSEVENTVFLLFLVIRYLNQRRLFLEGYRETFPKVRFVDVVLMARSFTFPLSGYSCGEAGRDKYYDSTVPYIETYNLSSFLSCSVSYMMNLFISFDIGNAPRHLALYNDRLFLLLSEIWIISTSRENIQDSELLSVLEQKIGHSFDNKLLSSLLEFACLPNLSEPASDSSFNQSILIELTNEYSNLVDSSLSGTVIPKLPLPPSLIKLLHHHLVGKCIEVLNVNRRKDPLFIAIHCFDKLCDWNPINTVCDMFWRHGRGKRDLLRLQILYQEQKGTLNGKKGQQLQVKLRHFLIERVVLSLDDEYASSIGCLTCKFVKLFITANVVFRI
ncbi:hypothetical protein GEMRC1_003379 [Eukaryota sp. GEM-RC1]